MMTFKMESDRLPVTYDRQENGATVVESLLRWIPLVKDDGQYLACKAQHPKFQRFTLEQRVKMDIQCNEPMLEIRIK